MGSQPGTKVRAVTNSRHCRNEQQHSILYRLPVLCKEKRMLGWIADVSLIAAGTLGFVYDLIAKHHISWFNFYPGIRLCTYLHELSLLFFSQSWLFFEKTPRPWFKEHGLVSFPNTGSPLEEYNYAFCKVSVVSLDKSGLRGCGCVHVVHW